MSDPQETQNYNPEEATSTTEVFAGNQGEPSELSPEELKEMKCNRLKKGIFALLLVGFIAYIIVDSVTAGNVSKAVNAFLEWIEENPIPGVFAFMLVYIVATVLFIPGSILTLGAGFVFANAFGLGVGVLLGTLSVFFGASAGAILAFLIGRFLMRDWVSTLSGKYAIFEALDAAFEEKGLRIMCLLRLSPVIPFNAINYVAGVTSIRFWQYVIALLAILPGTILYVFLGASAGSLADSGTRGENSTVTIIIVVVGVVFGILAVGATSYYAKQELNKIAEKRREEQEHTDVDEETGQKDLSGSSIEEVNDNKEEEDPTDGSMKNVDLSE